MRCPRRATTPNLLPATVMLQQLACAFCHAEHPFRAIATVCSHCGRSLSAVYDVSRLGAALRDGSIRQRVRSMWRYAEALPQLAARDPVSLGEGWTPLLRAERFGRRLGLPHLLVKDEGSNPTGSFKARGMSAAITAARDLGVTGVAAPSAGNAAGALAAYAARAGMSAHVFLPESAPLPNRIETRLTGAEVVTVTGNIATAAAALRRRRETDPVAAALLDVSTLKEPYRLDGKKTMGYELFEQLDGVLPDAILYPTGGGTGLLGMMKAFDELELVGLLGSARPRMIAIQADGCAPIVEAFARGADDSIAPAAPDTLASGLLVPKAFADWWILREIRRSGGTALAVSDADILRAIATFGTAEGILLCPEGAALAAALPRLLDQGSLHRDDRVVLFNTASPFKYPDALQRALA